MITKMQLAAGQSVAAPTGRTYIVDENGVIENVETADVGALLAAGAVPVVISAALHIVVGAGQVLHFDGATHQADENGLIRDVPYDIAVSLIKDPQHPAREATDEESALPAIAVATSELQASLERALEALEIAEAGAHTDAVMLSLLEKFSGIEIVDTNDVDGEHDDMIFAVMQGETELARGRVSELRALELPKPTSVGVQMTGPAALATAATQPAAAGPTAPAAPEGEQAPAPKADTADQSDASAVAPHDGEPLPETAPAAAE